MIIALQSLIYHYFRTSLLRVLDRLIQPCYKSLTFGQKTDDEEVEEQVFAEYDEVKGVVFYPAVYAQRYAAVSDCLMDERWCGQLEKVVDLGYHDMSFIKYLKELPGIKSIIGVDIESIPLQCSSDLISGNGFMAARENPIKIRLFQGNAADPDYRLIGTDALVAIEMIEHMLPHDLERLVHTIFGFIKPRIAVITTPNGDFNVLFKALERNGFRRLDHYFEWSREQFHDWCTNIVLRYPDYTVTCKGIGPGPEGTDHLGCCSQLALFICKEYHKQQELSLDSLALVSEAPSPDNFDDILDSCDSRDDITVVDNTESLSNLSESHSSIKLYLSPPFCYNAYGNTDKVTQCDIDNDKGYMMDEDQTGVNVVVARRRVNLKVYEMEDVASRLNCSTMKVNRFSKSTQKLMAKNKIDSLIHTRDVVSQIKLLTRMLNLKDRRRSIEEEHVWCNINWGDNAPYWNQYYRLVREYDYPYKEKPQDCIIMELISDELHQLMDAQCDEELTGDARLEVPLKYLMKTVEHLTDDVEKVRELLDWSGYEIVDEMVIYKRQLEDDTSDSSSEAWREHDNFSEGDTTEIQSMTHSDGSKLFANYHARLRRALEHKIRKLRSTAADEDITSELERVVCRLMKLALKTSRGRSDPPPVWWLQAKLYDLLSLSERAIEKRRLHFLKNFDGSEENDDLRSEDTISILNKFKEDTTAQEIMDKYKNLIDAPVADDMEPENYDEINLELDDISINSSDGYMQDYQFSRQLPNIKYPLNDPTQSDPTQDELLARTKAWVDHDITPTPLESSQSVVTDVEETNTPKTKTKKVKRQRSRDLGSKSWRKFQNKLKNSLVYKDEGMIMNLEYDFEVNQKELQHLPSNSKPIPDEMIELCSNKTESVSIGKNIDYTDDSKQHGHTDTISATEDSFVIDIVTEQQSQKVALWRSVGTEPEVDESDIETLVAEVTDANEPFWVKQVSKQESMFLYDINQPSTSKGIHRLRADVQCGPDTKEMIHYPSPETSNNIVKVEGSMNNMLTASKKSVEFGTCTQEREVRVVTSRTVSVGIKINDSDSKLKSKYQAEVTEQLIEEEETTFLKPVSSNLKMDDSIPEFCSSFGNSPTHTLNHSPNASIAIETVQPTRSPTKYERPKLSCGGVHVHSYKDKQVLEDVVYQGEWQRYRPKTAKPLPRKKPATVVVKKSDPSLKRKSVRSKEKLTKRPTQSCDTSPAKKPMPTFAERMVKVNQDIAKKAELGKKLRAPVKNLAKKKSSPTNAVPKACIVSKRVTPKTSLILRKDSKKQLKPRSRVPIPKTPADKKSANLKAKPIKTTNAALYKNKLESDVKAKIEDLKRDIFKSGLSPPGNVSYVVYRSEVTTNSDADCGSPVRVKRIEGSVQSPDFRSSCSSRNSVATVRALNTHSSRTSPVRSSHVHSLNTSPVRSSPKQLETETEAGTSKTKKNSKKTKGPIDDKENTSLSSARSNLSNKEAAKPTKSPFTGRNKNVFVTKMNAENSKANSVLSKPVNQTENKSISKIPVVAKIKSPTLSRKTISPERTVSKNNGGIVKEITKKIIEANVVLVTSTPKKEQFEQPALIQPETSQRKEIEADSNRENEELKIEIQRIVDESLDFITDDEVSKISSNTEETKKNYNPEKSLPTTPKKQNSGNPLTRTFDVTLGKESIVSLADTVVTLTDTDFMSFKSMTSVSKMSEYFLADTELDDQLASPNSVKDIFERKDQLKLQVPSNVKPIAMQAFSGLSLGGEPVVGDRPDPLNLGLSEPGSLAAAVNRQITSEELFISGRSSGSFESCWMEENSSVVPDWLFQAMNQASNNGEEAVPLPLPIEIPPPNDENTYDENGNVDPPLGADAGAGDGCGMHSDLSEDSSDDTTLSSDDTSAEQSETILVDPTAVAAHYEAFRNAISSSTLRIPPVLDETTGALQETAEIGPSRLRPLRNLSGFDADVSSLTLEEAIDVPLAHTTESD